MLHFFFWSVYKTKVNLPKPSDNICFSNRFSLVEKSSKKFQLASEMMKFSSKLASEMIAKIYDEAFPGVLGNKGTCPFSFREQVHIGKYFKGRKE